MIAVVVDRFGGPDVLLPTDRPDPTAEGGRVLVRLHAAGVNPVDAICRSGGADWMRVPFIPGFDGAGVVEAAPDETGLRIGQPVYVALAGATYAEKVACDSAAVHPLPESVSFAHGAALGIPYATAFGALFLRAGLKPGEHVLIRGAAGAVGWAALQWARAVGARVIGTAGSDDGLALLREHGAIAVDHRDPEETAVIQAATGGRGVDVIVETQSSKLGEDLAVIAENGRVAVIGDRHPVTIDPLALTGRRAMLIGINVGAFSPAENTIIHAAVAAGLTNGTLGPRIAATYPLLEAAQAHHRLGAPGLNGKIVLTM